MTENKGRKKGQTSNDKNLTDKRLDLTIDQESQTNENNGQAKKEKSQTTVKWSVTTEKETRTAVVKAAKKDGKGLFEWIDQKLMEASLATLTKKATPPAKPEDMVKGIVEQYAERIKADQEATVNAQNALIEQQGQQLAILTEAINNQPKSLKEFIFGKSKKD